MTEVENCGGGHRTRVKINLCLLGVLPSPVYKGGEEEAGSQQGARQGGGLILLLGVGLPPFLVQEGEEGEGGGGEKEGVGGRCPFPLSN